MFQQSPIVQLAKKSKFLLLVGVVVGVAVGLISLLLPLQYRADAQILLISQSRYGVDPYTATKSAERIGENLAQLVETSDFFNKVFAQGDVVLDQSRYQGISEQKRRDRWQRDVDAGVVYGTSVLSLSAYHTSAAEAERLVGALANAMVVHGQTYVGGDVQMRIVNQPVVTNYPVRPNIMVHIVLGMLAGMFLAATLVLRKR
jgi:capsular polysaccharide biosynthesis protein